MIGKTLRLQDDEVVLVTSNWTAECRKAGTTIESSDWSTTAGSVAEESLGDYIATALLTENGEGQLKHTVTLADGQTLIRTWKIEVR